MLDPKEHRSNWENEQIPHSQLILAFCLCLGNKQAPCLTTVPCPKLAQCQLCSHSTGREQRQWLSQCISFQSEKLMLTLWQPYWPHRLPHHCITLIVMLRTENEEEHKEWRGFLSPIDVKYVSVGFIITHIHEIESKKPQEQLLNHLQYTVGSSHNNHKLNNVDKNQIIFK